VAERELQQRLPRLHVCHERRQQIKQLQLGHGVEVQLHGGSLFTVSPGSVFLRGDAHRRQSGLRALC